MEVRLLFVVILLATHLTGITVSLNTCACSVFPSDTVKEGEMPVAERPIPVPLPCNAVGGETCKQLCITLAEVSRADPNAGDLLCAEIKQPLINNLQVFIHYKLCDGAYKYTELNYPKPVCCDGNKAVPCKVDE